jgi:capsular polysaccharide export protein
MPWAAISLADEALRPSPKQNVRSLIIDSFLLRHDPHLPAFWPEREIRPFGEEMALPALAPAPSGLRLIRYAPGPWRTPRFAARQAPPVALVIGAADDPVSAALAEGLHAPPDAVGLATARRVMARFGEARLGGPPGLPDPGPAALPTRGAVVVLDPCQPDQAERARALLAAAARGAGGRPVLVARDPFAPTGARPLLPGAIGPFDPWTLLEAAVEWHTLSAEAALPALAAGVPLHGPLPFAGADPARLFAALIARTRCADPFRCRPWSLDEALEQLAEWRAREAENRRVAVCLGMQQWKQARVGQLFASAAGEPVFRRSPSAALRLAKRRGGALVAWASAASDDLTARCAAAGVELLFLEDGFIRSAGLGAEFRPGGSFALDRGGAYYDPARPSDLERLLATADFPPALLKRAASLRESVVTRGITKYNLSGAMPEIAAPPGLRRILVPGQVEDDASVLRGGGAVRGNLALLRAVRESEPDAYLIYKPHPDLEAGYRSGRLSRAELDGLADQVVSGASIAKLLDQVDAVHTLTSLTGFEALLRGLPVTCWGRPFYAGWGLTDDRDPPPRRTRRLTLDQLVAGALILYPRYLDPVTGVPCSVEVFLERLARPELWPLGRLSLCRRARGAVTRALARWRGLS